MQASGAGFDVAASDALKCFAMKSGAERGVLGHGFAYDFNEALGHRAHGCRTFDDGRGRDAYSRPAIAGTCTVFPSG